MPAELDPSVVTGSITTGPVEAISGALPMMPVTNAGNGRRQVTIEGCRIAGHAGGARVPVGRVSAVEAVLLTSEPAQLRARAVVTSPSQQITVIDLAPLDEHRFRAPFVPAELGVHQVRIEAWVDHPAMWLEQAVARVVEGTAGGLTLQRGSAILFGASLRANHGDREVLGLASKLLAAADHPALLQSEQVRHAVVLAGLYPDIDMVTVETSWHPVQAQPTYAASGAWCVVAPPATEPADAMAVLAAALERAAQLGLDVVCVDLTDGGREGCGLVGPDPAVLEGWRDLACRARSRGVHLGVRLGMGCDEAHPWRRDNPWWFKGQEGDGGAVGDLDFETQDWGALWHAVESLWQSWLEVGVDAFVVHAPHKAPIRFWDWLVPTLRRRDLNLVVGTTGLEDPLIGRRLGGSGVDLVFLDCAPACWSRPVAGEDGLDTDDAHHDAEPSQARAGRWVAATSPAPPTGDWLRAVLFAGLSGASYATEVAIGDLLSDSAAPFEVLVNLHAWRQGTAAPLRRVDTGDEAHLVVLAALDVADRAVIVPAGAEPARARQLLDELLWRGGTPDHGWLDVLAGVVVDAEHLLPEGALPARLLVPLPPA